MNRFNWQIVLGFCLVALSTAIYIFHYIIFRDAHHIFLYLIGDIAFVFIEVLLVSLIIHKILSVREKRSLLNKLNMAIGVFFTEVGTPLLNHFAAFDEAFECIRKDLIIQKTWDNTYLSTIQKKLKNHAASVNIDKGSLKNLKSFLSGKRDFMLSLLENANLLEHETFTELLWAVFHLTEELTLRKDVGNLPEADREHIAVDINRAYKHILIQWLAYMKHLKHKYPYLFLFALRTNPIDPDACVEVLK